MSHFAMLVIGDNVEKQLQPFHEYECTGIEDEYVVFVPAEESLEELQAEHQRHLTEYPDSTPEDLGQHLKEWNGYELKDGQWGRMTNPNAKWDWWQVGGRFQGCLKLKPGVTGSAGSPSLIYTAKQREGYVSSAKKGDVDFESMRQEAADSAASKWDEAFEVTKGVKWESWPSCRERFDDIHEARDFYHAQPGLIELKEKFDNPFMDFDQFNDDREPYIQKAMDSATVFFGFLRDGKWVERGNMGWFGMVSDEKDSDDWDRQFNKMLDELPDDALLTIVDCHI